MMPGTVEITLPEGSGSGRRSVGAGGPWGEDGTGFGADLAEAIEGDLPRELEALRRPVGPRRVLTGPLFDRRGLAVHSRYVRLLRAPVMEDPR